ncbi:MAG: methyl-accepting chemotaxis protein [Candidatus Accumulibacter sp.]|jgi:methyl-accepting chemotaxis protein|nr:methyl-accepting chemotaxis protein [Accumulibacter sp.]
MKIRTKLLLLTLCSLAATVLVGGLALFGITTLSGSIVQLAEVIIPARGYVNHVKMAEANIRITMNRAIVIAGYDHPADARNKFTAILKEYDEQLALAKQEIQAFLNMPRTEEAAQKLEPVVKPFLQVWETWTKDIAPIRGVMENLIALPPDSSSEHLVKQAATVLRGQEASYKALDDSLDALIHFEDEVSKQNEHEGAVLSRNLTVAQIVIVSMAILVIFALSWLVIRSIMKPLESTRQTMERITTDNDLTLRVDVDGKDEISEVVKSFNALAGRLQETLAAIQTGAKEVSNTAQAVSSTASQVASSSSNQSSATSAMATAVEEMTVSIGTVSNSAEEAQALASEAEKNSVEGGQIILRTASEMDEIATSVSAASDVIIALGENSKQISSVVQVIKEVADQTNLLALNAAIEAARAGEQGRGFAVVADEVRKLAERTAQSTLDIGTMIDKIQASANGAVETMHHVVEQMEAGKALAREAGERMTSIQASADKVSLAVTEISDALREQSRASQDIAKHVESVAQITDENNAAAEASLSNARQLEELAQKTEKAVQVFKL